jgi:hypothetical protein
MISPSLKSRVRNGLTPSSAPSSEPGPPMLSMTTATGGLPAAAAPAAVDAYRCVVRAAAIAASRRTDVSAAIDGAGGLTQVAQALA